MRVRSKLADVEFRFGHVERKGNELIIYSHPDQALKSRVHIAPEDVISAMKMLLLSRVAWVYALGFPYFYMSARREGQQSKKPI